MILVDGLCCTVLTHTYHENDVCLPLYIYVHTCVVCGHIT